MRTLPRLSMHLLLMVLTALPVTGSVKLKTLEDGTVVMYNERSSSKRPMRPRPVGGTTFSRSDLEGFVLQHARGQGLDPELVKAVVQVESGFYPLAQSHKGAMGLMQLMPATARELAVDDPWDPNQNLRGGTTYLRHLLDLFGGQLELALAGYNAGPESVERYGGIPPFDETRDYVEKVLRIYRGEGDAAVDTRLYSRRGRKTYLSRDANGQFVLTTSKTSNR